MLPIAVFHRTIALRSVDNQIRIQISGKDRDDFFFVIRRGKIPAITKKARIGGDFRIAAGMRGKTSL